jgi:nicotinamidase-related amidase
MRFIQFVTLLCIMLLTATSTRAEVVKFTLRKQVEATPGSGEFQRVEFDTAWPMESTAIIVCDVWDYHHCLNAVKRLDEFTPRLNEFAKTARQFGATIIHAPSDCMEAYGNHPARLRTLQTPRPEKYPVGIEHWVSRIPQEEGAVYPIDQSDGGEDDDPQEHDEWAAKLKALGRNPGMPWKSQSATIEIDGERDFITDRGDEVWKILEARGIENVILTGVHANMCVLGRPFGLRQMVRNGKNVVFLRDLSDSMYNPARWPYTDHFTGHDLVVSYIERHVCPTITSDQLLGGDVFVSKLDNRSDRDVAQVQAKQPPEWELVETPDFRDGASDQCEWYRCAVRLPRSWKDVQSLELVFPGGPSYLAWLNGVPVYRNVDLRDDRVKLRLPATAAIPDEVNLLVIRVFRTRDLFEAPKVTPELRAGSKAIPLAGRWQKRLGEDSKWQNIPLPAKFGAPPDIYFEAPDEPVSP